MHYAVGSISKQFTTAAVMLLQQEGKLSIDEPVSRWYPELTRANEVTLRNLLSHTSGYRDYAPQDYTIPEWTKPSSADRIVHQWATKPLDFDPGTQYQYSNTNFDLLGLIVEKVSGQPFWTFLKSRVLDPVGLAHAIDLDTQRDQLEPIGYFRNALGPLRPAIPEAPGWYFADGELAMPVGDLLRWDISMMNETLLSHASYAAMESPTRLRNGLYSNYGARPLRRRVERTPHDLAQRRGRRLRRVERRSSPTTTSPSPCFTNQEASPAAGAIGRALTLLLIPAEQRHSLSADATARAEQLARTTLAALQKGTIDPARFTDNAKFYFGRTALGDYASSLGKLGAIRSVHQTGRLRPRRHDLSWFRRGVRERHGREPLDVHGAGWAIRAVPRGAGGVGRTTHACSRAPASAPAMGSDAPRLLLAGVAATACGSAPTALTSATAPSLPCSPAARTRARWA